MKKAYPTTTYLIFAVSPRFYEQDFSWKVLETFYFAVIQLEWERKIKPPELANVLVEISDILPADALILAGRAKGIVGRNLEEEKAEKLVNRLKELGIDAFIVAESRLIKIPKVFEITQVKCLSDNLLISLGLAGEVYPVKWNDIFSISCGYVRKVTKGKDPSLGQAFGGILGTHIPYIPGGGVLGIGIASFISSRKWTAENLPREKTEYPLLMDIIIKNPVARLRIKSTRFAYATLGSKMKTNTLDNFKELLREISSHTPQAYLGRGAKMLLGEEKTQKITFPNLREFDCYNAWLAQVAAHQPKKLNRNYK